ncbi:ATP-binding cassette domain-containing protein [Glutamicibacter sp. X7]
MSPGFLADFTVQRAAFEVRVELELHQGQVLALMGPSGAGKSTIVSAIAGLERIDAGRISLDGTVLASPGVHLPPHRRSIGLLGQEPNLFPHLDARANIAFGARAAGMAKAAALALAEQWLERIGLPDMAARKPAELSGGQRQRVALARALAAGPRMLMVDEPFVSLDVEAAADMRTLLRHELDRTKTRTIVISHSAVDAVELADELIVIEHGSVVQRGQVRHVLAQPQTRFVRAVAATLPAADDPARG